MNYSRALLVSLILSPLAGCGPKTYTLKLDPKAGETFSYSTSMSGAVSMEMPMTMKVVKSDPNQVVIETRIGAVTVNGQPLPGGEMMKNAVMTITEDHTGHVQNASVTGVPPQLQASMQNSATANQASYPDHPVKIGDTWSGETSSSGQKVAASYKLVKIDTVAGKQAAILEVTPEGAKVASNGPMTLSIELANGMPIEMSGSFQVMGKAENMKMTRS